MANTSIAELPVMNEIDFTDNDRFLIVDDGRARLLPKTAFQSWLSKNVVGTKGEQGVAGKDGLNGKNGLNGLDGKDGLSAYQIAVSNGFVGTMPEWVTSLKGTVGTKGEDGGSGWTPIIRTVLRGSDTVLQLTDWVGGTGTKPTLLGYIGDTGIVSSVVSATNIKGAKGDKGEQGLQGEQGISGTNGTNGIDGKSIQSLTFKDDSSLLVTYSDATTVTSSVPPKPYGWATYKDGQYTDTTPFNITTSSQIVIPNSATTKIENLPSNQTSFYNPTLQKYLLTDPNGFYSVRVKFKVAASSLADTINVSMSKATTDTPFSEDRALRGDNKIQDMNFNTIVYGDAALTSNGLTIQVKTYDRAVSIYNIEVTIAKLI